MNYYQSAILWSVSPNCCNPYICTKCGASTGGPICCDETEPISPFARLLGPHPIRQHHADRGEGAA